MSLTHPLYFNRRTVKADYGLSVPQGDCVGIASWAVRVSPVERRLRQPGMLFDRVNHVLCWSHKLMSAILALQRLLPALSSLWHVLHSGILLFFYFGFSALLRGSPLTLEVLTKSPWYSRPCHGALCPSATLRTSACWAWLRP